MKTSLFWLSLSKGLFWGRKEKIKLEKLTKVNVCERRTRNGDQLFVHFWGMKEIGGEVFQTSMVGHKFQHEKLPDYDKPYRFQLGLGEVIQGTIFFALGILFHNFLTRSITVSSKISDLRLG